MQHILTFDVQLAVYIKVTSCQAATELWELLHVHPETTTTTQLLEGQVYASRVVYLQLLLLLHIAQKVQS